MINLLQNPMVVYGLSFCIFAALAVRYGRKPLLVWLDAEIEKIRAELHAAHALRAEAEALLADCKAKQSRAEAEAKQIVATAKLRVEAMRQKAEEDLAASLTRREYLAGERIRLAETEAIGVVRKAAIELAVSMARQNLTENMSGDVAATLVDRAIADLPALGAGKAA